MIHVVIGKNQHLYARQLDAMFRMRHAFYIEGHGWSGLTSQDGKEIDEFDDDNVVYLMSIDPWGDVAASVRLNPTTGPTLLKKFASWSDEALPVAEDCWDISRWIAAPQHRRANNSRWPSNHQRELMIGILEFCESRGLTRLTMLAELRLAERIAAYGWPLRRLGAPQVYEGGKGTAVAAEIRVGSDILALTHQKTGVFEHVLFEIDPAKTPPPAIQAAAPAESTLQLIEEIGLKPLQRLLHAMATEIGQTEIEDIARAVELIGALNRILEACGSSLQPKAVGGAFAPSSLSIRESRATGA
jgi:acyl-homoserine lactone synthase